MDDDSEKSDGEEEDEEEKSDLEKALQVEANHAYNLIIGVQEQLYHSLIGSITWITSFQLNRAINDLIYNVEKAYVHFTSTIILMIINIIILYLHFVSNDKIKQNWNIRTQLLQIVIGCFAFTASIQLHTLINEIINENNLEPSQRHRATDVIIGRGLAILGLICGTVASASTLNWFFENKKNVSKNFLTKNYAQNLDD